MSDNKQPRNKRGASPIRVGNHCMDVIRELQRKAGGKLSQRELIEQHLELAFRVRRISFRPAEPLTDLRRKQSTKTESGVDAQ